MHVLFGQLDYTQFMSQRENPRFLTTDKVMRAEQKQVAQLCNNTTIQKYINWCLPPHRCVLALYTQYFPESCETNISQARY